MQSEQIFEDYNTPERCQWAGRIFPMQYEQLKYPSGENRRSTKSLSSVRIPFLQHRPSSDLIA